MSEPTKACNLTADEIKTLIKFHCMNMCEDKMSPDALVERVKYLNSRLKAFNEPAADLKSEPEAASGWASN